MNEISTSTPVYAFRDKWVKHIEALQDKICAALETTDGNARFKQYQWLREEGKGGGGKTRIIERGNIFEKAGVNTSVVYGLVTEKMKYALGIDGYRWFAAGLSLVIHPKNPYVPTVHANWRYFELYDEQGNISDRWFGGGTDLTPYYLFEEDAKHFHGVLKNVSDQFGKEIYPENKKRCDQYFTNAHRDQEMRGIGGVFYDHLRPVDENDGERLFRFQQANGDAFLEGYLPIVERRKDIAYGERELHWQEIRRGRYVEFNLIHDRGTLFGLKTKGRTESILMSLPPRARWEYDYKPEAGSLEEELLNVCLHPREWA